MIITPKQLNLAGVSPLLCIIWLFLLLFTGSLAAGTATTFVLDTIFMSKFGVPTFTYDFTSYKESLMWFLKVDATFYFFVYTLFIVIKRKENKS